MRKIEKEMNRDTVIQAVLALVDAEINDTREIPQWECGQDAFDDGMRQGMIHIYDMIIQEFTDISGE